MSDDNLDDVLSIFDDDKKEENLPVAEPSEEKPQAKKGPGATVARPPMGLGKHPGKPLMPAGNPKNTQNIPRPPAPAVPPATAGVKSGASPLLPVLLVLNVILLVLLAVSTSRLMTVSKRLDAVETKVSTLVERSKVCAGISYLGPDKRAQHYIMLLDYDKEPGKIKFGNKIYQPVE